VKDPKDPTKMTKPNVGVRTMLTMGPLKNHVQDGQFGIGITGMLKSPRVQPERPRTRVGGAGVTGGGRKLNVDQPGDEDEGEAEGDEAPARAKRSSPTPPPAPPAEVPSETSGRGKDGAVRPLTDRPSLPTTRPGLDATNRPLVKPAIGGRNSIGRPRPKIGAEPIGGEAAMPEGEELGDEMQTEPEPEQPAPAEEEAPAPELEPTPEE